MGGMTKITVVITVVMPVVVVVVMPVVVLPVVMMPVSVSVTPAVVTSSNELVSTAKDSLDVPRSDTVI